MEPKAEIVDTPPMSEDELREADARRERFRRNVHWLAAQGAAIGEKYAGKFICVVGQELFARDTPEEARASGRAVHPEDDAPYCRYISPHRGPRIYARLG